MIEIPNENVENEKRPEILSKKYFEKRKQLM